VWVREWVPEGECGCVRGGLGVCESV